MTICATPLGLRPGLRCLRRTALRRSYHRRAESHLHPNATGHVAATSLPFMGTQQLASLYARAAQAD